MTLIGSFSPKIIQKSDTVPSIPLSELKLGDVWQQTENGLVIKNWQWMVDRWVSDCYQASAVVPNLGSTTVSYVVTVDLSSNLQLKSLNLSYLVAGSLNTATTHRIFRLYRVSATNSVLLAQSNTIGSNVQHNLIIPINLDDILTLNQTLYYRLDVSRVGSPGTTNATARLIYRHWQNHI